MKHGGLGGPPAPALQPQRLATCLKALADDNRVRIIALLAHRPRYGEELVELLGLSPATVSHHLARLRGAHLVGAHKEPPYVRYHLRGDTLDEVSRLLARRQSWSAALELPDDEAMGERILREVLDHEGRLRELPSIRRKRGVVLRWLAHHFETGRIYPEREIRRVLMETARPFEEVLEALLEEGWILRSGGVFRRVEEAHEP